METLSASETFKWFLFLGLICILSSTAYSQDSIKGKITDLAHKPIHYASIGYFNSKIGATSDSNGEFTIRKIEGDSLKISFIGFHYKVIVIDQKTAFIKINLEQKINKLEEVIVKSRRKTKNKVTIGHFIKEKISTYSYKGHQNLQRAVFIPNHQKIEGYIDEILFPLHDHRNKKSRLRIRVYSANPLTGLPHEDLLLTENILEPGKFRKLNKFSIKSHNIEMPAIGIWISFEFLPIKDTLTNQDIPNIGGNNKADKFYMVDNFKDMKWIPIHRTSKNYGGRFVLNVSITVSY